MIRLKKFAYNPGEYESEKASNSYLMSLVALMMGWLPLAVINLLATLIFYLGNRKGTYFVRWHCTQALLSQFSLFFINGFGFWWTVAVVFLRADFSNFYISYMAIAVLFNLLEFIVTIYTAIQTRKGIHVEWWFYGNLTHLICKTKLKEE